jgi:hypothetical protein
MIFDDLNIKKQQQHIAIVVFVFLLFKHLYPVHVV